MTQSNATLGGNKLSVFLIAVLGLAALVLLIGLFIVVQGHVRDIDRRTLELREAQAEVEGLERQRQNLVRRVDELTLDRDERQAARDRAVEQATTASAELADVQNDLRQSQQELQQARAADRETRKTADQARLEQNAAESARDVARQDAAAARAREEQLQQELNSLLALIGEAEERERNATTAAGLVMGNLERQQLALAAAVSALAPLQSNIDDLRIENSQLTASLQGAAERLEQSMRAAEEAEALRDNAIQARFFAQTQLAELQGDILTLTPDVEALREERDALAPARRALGQVRAEVDYLRALAAQIAVDDAAALEAGRLREVAEANLSNIRTQVRSATEELSDQRAEAARLQDVIDQTTQIEARAQEARDKLSNLQQQIGMHQQQLTGLTDDLAAAQADIARAAQVGADQAAVDAAVERRLASENEARTSAAQLRGLAAQTADLRAEIASLELRQTQVALDDAAVIAARQQREDAEATLAGIRVEIQSAEADFTAQRAEAARLEDLLLQADRIEGRVSDAREQLADLNRQIGGADGERVRMSDEINGLRTDLDHARMVLDGLLSSMEDATLQDRNGPMELGE